MAIAQQQVLTTQNNIVTVPAGKRYAITNILVCNTYDPNAGDAASNSASFDLSLLPNGEALDGLIHRVVRELNLPAGETFTFDTERIVLEAGDAVILIGQPDIGSNKTNLAATVSYLEV
jgi:hypothetical protein